jgi:hypothetical protein
MPKAKRRRRKRSKQSLRRRVVADVLGMISSARESSKTALHHLRKEITAARSYLDELIEEERSFRLDLFGTSGAGRPRKVGRPAGNKSGRPAKPRRKGPPKADRYFKKLPNKFTIDDVRKLAGEATGVSLAQWARSKKVKKTGGGYEKIAA